MSKQLAATLPSSAAQPSQYSNPIRANGKSVCSDPERGWIYHRNREQPTPDPKEPPISQIKFYLDRYRIKDALQIFFDDNTLGLLRAETDFMWDIIPLICKRLRGLCQYRFRVFEGCERMLCRIAVDQSCNPKEVLISLLAEIGQQEQYQDDNVFRAMIRPLEGTLLRMNCPSPRDENLRWVLNVLLRHINEIELPPDHDLESKKRIAFSNDPNVKRFIEVLPLMLGFVEEFNDRSLDIEKSPMPILTESQIDEVLNGDLLDDNFIGDYHSIISDNVVSSVATLSALMYRPLTFLDLTNHCDDLKLFANRCLNTLLRLRPDLFSPIYKRLTDNYSHWDQDSSGMSAYNLSCTESTISLATCSYIYRCERLMSADTIQSFPQVITSESVLFCHLPYVIALLERSEVLVHEKGLVLLESLLRRIENHCLGQKFLDCFLSNSLLDQLFGIMIYSPLSANRRKAYDLFISLCDSLVYDCKFKVFKHILTQVDLRPSIRAACIDQYRRHLTNLYRELNYKNSSSLFSKSSDHETRESSVRLGPQDPIAFSPDSTNQPVTNVLQMKQSSSLFNDTSEPGCSRAHLLKVQKLQNSYSFLGGQPLVEFLDLCIEACLNNSQHTDIIENYEVLLATLTLFRFLKLRKAFSTNEIETDYLNGKRLKKSFFDPIRSAIALVTNELKTHHKSISDQDVECPNVTHSSLISKIRPENELCLLSRILGPKLDEFIEGTEDDNEARIGKQDEVDCVDWALCRLDLVESVLVRTCDLYYC